MLAYLGRYTHRVALSNQRLQSLQDGKVVFQWKDYRDHNRSKLMQLEVEEFLRRFLLHALPPHFQRIRNYGFLANSTRREKLALCRRFLLQDRTGLLPQPSSTPALSTPAPGEPVVPLCPVCGQGQMLRLQILSPVRKWSGAVAPDSS